MIVDSLSNGLGGPSMWLLWLAAEKRIPATVSITADTGSENDRLLCDGSRISARDFFERHVKPICERSGIVARFVRSKDEDGNDLPPLHEHMAMHAGQRDNVPLYGSEGGQLKQTCTDKWKVRAIKQCLRSLGAKKARTAIGLHINEYMRRASGKALGKFTYGEMSYVYYQTMQGRKKDAKPIKWLNHYYPAVDHRYGRQQIHEDLERHGIPYLKTSECDHCPHKDAGRWLDTSPETIDELATLEKRYNGEFFLTDRRIPLKMAIEDMKSNPGRDNPLFGCHNAYCGI